jgi:hypothetical protein
MVRELIGAIIQTEAGSNSIPRDVVGVVSNEKPVDDALYDSLFDREDQRSLALVHVRVFTGTMRNPVIKECSALRESQKLVLLPFIGVLIVVVFPVGRNGRRKYLMFVFFLRLERILSSLPKTAQKQQTTLSTLFPFACSRSLTCSPNPSS